MNNYWDVGQFFTVSMLANDIPKATQAAEKLFKLKPPLWYHQNHSFSAQSLVEEMHLFAQKCRKKCLSVFERSSPLRYLRSVVQNLHLIQRFKKQTVEHSPLREKLNFWMDIIVEATQGTTNRLRFPVRSLVHVHSQQVLSARWE